MAGGLVYYTQSPAYPRFIFCIYFYLISRQKGQTDVSSGSMENVEEKTAENVLRVSSSQQKNKVERIFFLTIYSSYSCLLFFGQKGKKADPYMCI
jgi:hypothetical protein